MKILLKLILFLCLVLAAVYAATPLWLPHIIGSQLPSGWQLEELQGGYPGLAGINIELLRARGEPGLAYIELQTADIRFSYRNNQIEIGLANLDIHMNEPEKGQAGFPTVEDLSLPVLELKGNLPRLSVSDMRVTLDRSTGPHDEAFRPLRLEFEDLELTPRSSRAFHLASRMAMTDAPQFRGQLDVDVSPDLIHAFIRSTSDLDETPWLRLEMEQVTGKGIATTRLKAVLDSETANREWLDSLLAGASRQVFTQLGGKLEMDATFSGHEYQIIESLSLISEDLRVVSGSGILDLSTEVLANRQGDDVAIELLSPTRFQYRGRTGLLSTLLGQIIPELQLTRDPEAMVVSELGAGSRFFYSSANAPSVGFTGDVSLNMTSATEKLTLQSKAIQVDMGDLNDLESTATDGLIMFAWQLDAPLSYTSEELQLEADKISLAGELESRGGKFVSKGNGKMTRARLSTHDVLTEEVEMAWTNLDIINLTGKLETRTRGFSIAFDEKAWKDFDLDMNYTLAVGNDVNGTGIMTFTNGQQFPLEFTGNTKAQRWKIRLLPATIRLAKLRKLLSAAHIQLPEAIKLTDGYIELRGEVLVGDAITADFIVSGHEMAASLMESRARKAGFSLKAGFDQTPWAGGPISIDVITLAGGVEVAQLAASLELDDTEHYGLRNISADVFDGQIKLGSLRFSGAELQDTTIELSHINLGQLLSYADIDGLEGEGFLDISLPIGIDQNGFHVKNGSFVSNGPGRLAYTKEGVAGSNIGLQALENFQYKDLSGTLNYQSDGNYVITIRLEGKNPNLYGGHPVVFNLNINGLLPEFFEAMFMTGSFEESILKQIKSR